ncbi:MAG: hypothetical protein K2Y40_09105 [Reyranella sp.]|jgi:flavodoxin|nr:hypothetical protein [Reyranella sp.]
MKILVAYFSLSGHTEAAAKAVASAVGADLERIESARPVPGNRFALLFSVALPRA